MSIFLRPAKTDKGWQCIDKNIKKDLFSEHTEEISMPAFLDSHQKKRAEAKPLSPALCMTVCCCATDVRALCCCVLCQLVVLHIQHPARGAS